MIFSPTAIAGAVLVDLERHVDERGFFARSWCADEFDAAGLPAELTQCSVSWNEHRHTIRGMHWQAAPHGEGKLIRCARGAIHDVVVDLRPDSPSYLEVVAVELDQDNRRALFAPAGVAHGFLTLAPETEVLYQMDTAYVPEAARGARWNDPAFGIAWPVEPAVISARDPHVRGPRTRERHGGERTVRVSEHASGLDLDVVGDAAYGLMSELFPICRSITGPGLRETLDRIGKLVPLQTTEVPTGTAAYDWTVPPEWTIRDAWVADDTGRRVVDFNESNLHVVNYSAPVRTTLDLDELRAHLHTLPEHPTWVPYRTAYYAESWGFCLSQERLDQLSPGRYEAVVDADLAPGSLTYGECVLPGETTDEILISGHCCHPSLANDNLSGVVVAAQLAHELAQVEHRYTYRFLFAPGTIGAIVWLSQHEDLLSRIRAGLVLACVGDAGPVVYKRSRRGDAVIDRAASRVTAQRSDGSEVIDFSPYGNDERQFCSPGIDLPVGAITRSGHDRSVRHHTSADDLDSIDPRALADTVQTCLTILGALEDDANLVSLSPKGEPQLGRRGLYRAFGGRTEQAALESALLWVMNLADGQHTVLDVAERSGLPLSVIDEAANALERVDLLRREPADDQMRSGSR